MNVYETIKKLRKSKGLTQAEMADKLNLATSNYTLLENGKTELTYSKMLKLAEVFGVSVGELLGLEGVQAVPNGEQARENEALKKENERLRTEAGLYKELKEKTDASIRNLLQQHQSFFKDCIKYVEKNIAPVFYGIDESEKGLRVVIPIEYKDAIFPQIPLQIDKKFEAWGKEQTMFETNLDFPPKPLDNSKKYVLVDVVDKKFKEHLFFNTPFIKNNIDFLRSFNDFFDKRATAYEELIGKYDFNVVGMYKSLIRENIKDDSLSIEQRNTQLLECWAKACEGIEQLRSLGWI